MSGKNWGAADIISCLAYSMHSKPFDSLKNDSFPMYSNDTPSNAFWRGFAEECLDSGLTENQTKELMRSSYMRHGLDNYSDKVEELGKRFLDQSMINWAKEILS